MAHTLSLLMKDIANSKQPSLLFVEKVYQRAKGVVKYIKAHFLSSLLLLHFLESYKLDGCDIFALLGIHWLHGTCMWLN